MAKQRKAVEGARAREGSNPARSDAGAAALDEGRHAREASNPARADAGAGADRDILEDPPHRIHPHDDEDVSQAFGSGDSEWQIAAGDGADRDPAEGLVEDYEREWLPDHREDLVAREEAIAAEHLLHADGRQVGGGVVEELTEVGQEG